MRFVFAIENHLIANDPHRKFAELAAASAESNYGVMSSFRPSNNAKLYASPEDMRSVGYRSLSLPNQATRSQLRKSHSLRTPNGQAPGSGASFKPGTAGQIANGAGPSANGTTANGGSQYAQPLKSGRSHSIAGIIRERKKKSSLSTSSSASNISGAAAGMSTLILATDLSKLSTANAEHF